MFVRRPACRVPVRHANLPAGNSAGPAACENAHLFTLHPALETDPALVLPVCVCKRPQGSRKRGRPTNSWRRSVIKEEGRSWNELRFLAADRSGKNSMFYFPASALIITLCNNT